MATTTTTAPFYCLTCGDDAHGNGSTECPLIAGCVCCAQARVGEGNDDAVTVTVTTADAGTTTWRNIPDGQVANLSALLGAPDRSVRGASTFRADPAPTGTGPTIVPPDDDRADGRHYWTVVATGYTTRNGDYAEIERAVRNALAVVGFEIVPCGWAPDLDTIADVTMGPDGEPLALGSNGLLDLCPPLDN